ncbi:hypothetical protein HS088_TW12G00428 [Tripterygium wilfordii]|uniref:Transmembrane protein n=2 Tax=Tripterygium wilfordii TaxID=458696 RepID=A0A7J7CZI4_TRIWF|nr:hypothetical protein HS088_TW12G00428 [Tripterygium wilfordii]
MDGLKNRNLVLFIFLLNAFFVLGYDGGRQGMEDHEQPHKLLSIFNMLRTATSTYCDRVKALVNQAHAHFFPPSLDFRSRDEGKEDGGGGGRTMEKVGEALASSLGKSEQTMEVSARTAATIAGKTVEKIKDKVKKTLSKRSPQPEPEL